MISAAATAACTPAGSRRAPPDGGSRAANISADIVRVVERTFAGINQFRRLVIRYESDLYRAFLVIAATIICFEPSRRILSGDLRRGGQTVPFEGWAEPWSGDKKTASYFFATNEI